MEKKKSVITQLFEYAGNHKYFTISSWILAAISALVALAPFYYIWRIIKEVVEVRPDFSKATHIVSYGWSAVGMSLLAMAIYIAALMCSHVAAFRVQAGMRTAMMEHVMKLPMGYIEFEGSGKIRKIVAESSAATETYLAHSLPDKAVSYATPVGLIAMLLIFDWKIGLICLIPAALAFVMMGGMMGEKMQNDMKEYQNALDEMSAEAVEYVRGIPVVKTFGQSVFSFKRFKEAIDKYEKWTITYTIGMRMPMIGFTTAANAVFAALVACSFIFARNGVADTFLYNILFYIIITPILTVTLMKVAYAGESQMIVVDALNRMYSLLDVQPLEETSNPKKPADSSIVMDDIVFSYDENKGNAIDGISLDIKPGEHIAFVGPSGGGKTTLASLIARFWDVKQGSIRIGGADVRDISSKELMKNVSYVFQDSKLLKMSILDNVRMGREDASDAEVIQALKDAMCWDIIEKLPEGINTVIGSKGTYVSGGEAQRISIARAFLKDAPILILDEATAFADPDNEMMVQKAFANLSKDKTVIMIAHRLSTVVNADKICVIKDGKIAESGKHEELLLAKGIYSHMWNEYQKSVGWKVGKGAKDDRKITA
ncbi:MULTISPECIES: ABC transporter ATP-binding protein [unclassified Butyrivibrio]|uniref:ABC transporter ATP-binding protein n=1 Tax=unclassified Butyrivibrio TaxID=2639466 RepID=UPI0004069024|nr:MULTISPECIES: ABC transporter ATP-binding protein [unclassified Butyrivibrio]